MALTELSRNLELLRNTVRRKLQRLIEIGLVECIDHRYYMTAKANAPLQREVLLAHLCNMQAAINEVSKMDSSAVLFFLSEAREASGTAVRVRAIAVRRVAVTRTH